MSTKAPPTRAILALVGFVLATVGLTIWLLEAFGANTPLQARGYRVQVPFTDAAGLTVHADVRIAGVDVGHVVAKRLAPGGRRTIVTLDLDPKYAPRPVDTRAILRQKTVLGETYVQLSAGSRSAPRLRDGATLAAGRVDELVHFDDVLRTFDPATRESLGSWLTEQGTALQGGGPALSAALAALPALGRHGTEVLGLLADQQSSLSALVRDGGTSLAAETVRELPGFLRRTRDTSERVGGFAREATPLVVQLRPAARRLTPVLRDTATLAQPVVAALLGWWAFGEAVTPVQALGGAVALAGVALAQAGARAPAPAQGEAEGEAASAPLPHAAPTS